jgi:hypothetical protein
VFSVPANQSHPNPIPCSAHGVVERGRLFLTVPALPAVCNKNHKDKIHLTCIILPHYLSDWFFTPSKSELIMSDKNKNKIASELIVLHGIPAHQQLITARSGLLGWVIFLMTVILVAGFLAPPANDDIVTAHKKVAADAVYAADMTPPLSAEVDILKGQFVGLVSGSIESKLLSLEKSLRAGTVTNALGAIEDLRRDVNMLRLYSEPVKTVAVAPVSNAQLMQEMSQLKRLIYWTFASCGLVLAAVAGIWLRNLKKLPLKETISRYLGNH